VPFLTDVDTITVRRHGDDRWALTQAIRYRGAVDTFTVGAGYVTDFASIPPIIVGLIPRYGRWTPAAILHDYLITDMQPAGRITSHDTDGLFRRVLRELGVSTPHRWLMWAGVRWGSLTGGRWHAADWATLPAVLGVSVLALPVVLPVAAGTAVGRALLAAVELIWRPAPPAREPLRVVRDRSIPPLDLEALSERDGRVWGEGREMYYGEPYDRSRPVEGGPT
jgi:hypothetical protein